MLRSHVLYPPARVLTGFHRVAAGDTLDAIPADFGRPNHAYDELVAANLGLARRRGLLEAPLPGLGAGFPLHAGDELRIPASWMPAKGDCAPCKAAARRRAATRGDVGAVPKKAMPGQYQGQVVDTGLTDNTLDPLTLAILDLANHRQDGWVNDYPAAVPMQRAPVPAAVMPGLLNAVVQWYTQDNPGAGGVTLADVYPYANAAAAFMATAGATIAHPEGIPWSVIPFWGLLDWLPVLASGSIQWTVVRDALAKVPAGLIKGVPALNPDGSKYTWHTSEAAWAPGAPGVSDTPWSAIPWAQVPWNLIPWNLLDPADYKGSAMQTDQTQAFLADVGTRIGVDLGATSGTGPGTDPTNGALTESLSYETARGQALGVKAALVGQLLQESPEAKDLAIFDARQITSTAALVSLAKVQGAGMGDPTSPSSVVWIITSSPVPGQVGQPLSMGTLQLGPRKAPGLSTEDKVSIGVLVCTVIGTVAALWPSARSAS